MEKPMKTIKHFEALVASKGKDGKNYWRRIGVAFPLKNKPGFSVKLELLPVQATGLIEFVLMEPSEKKAEPA